MSLRKPDGTIVDLNLPWEEFDPTAARAGLPSLYELVKLEAEGPLPITATIIEEANVAYVKLPTFMATKDPTKQLDKLFTDIKDTDGLILDLRGNGGGVGLWGVLVANYLIEAGADGPVPNDTYTERLYSYTFFRATLGQVMPAAQLQATLKSPFLLRLVFKQFGVELSLKEMKSHFENGVYVPFYHTTKLSTSEPGVAPYTKPVIALTDGMCFSTTDILLQLLSEFGRLKMVGTPNGAGSGSPIPFSLPNSEVRVMVPHARAYPPSGAMIEGRPLTPDVLVELTQEDVAAGVDRHLAVALSLLAPDTRLDSLSIDELKGRVVQEARPSRIPRELRALVPEWLVTLEMLKGELR